jgi:hypothetical protein
MPLLLQLELVRLDGSYVLGGEIQYEVIVKNVGNSAIDLPWSADRDAIEVTGLPFVQMSLSLVAKDRNGRDYTMGAVFLDGTSRMPETLQHTSTQARRLQSRRKGSCQLILNGPRCCLIWTPPGSGSAKPTFSGAYTWFTAVADSTVGVMKAAIVLSNLIQVYDSQTDRWRIAKRLR